MFWTTDGNRVTGTPLLHTRSSAHNRWFVATQLSEEKDDSTCRTYLATLMQKPTDSCPSLALLVLMTLKNGGSA